MASVCVSANHRGPFGTIDPIRTFSQASTLHDMRNLRALKKSHRALSGTRVGLGVEGDVFGFASASTSLVIASSMLVGTTEKATEVTTISSSAARSPSVTDDAPTEQPPEDLAEDPKSTLQTDRDIEALIERIQDNVVIKDVPIKSPQWIQVPKGYVMDLEVRPSNFLRYKAEVATQVKKRKREEGLPKWSQRGWQNRLRGFRPEEVNWNGAVCIENCMPSNLTNEIHPLFDRSCFDDTPDAIYDQLIPALQLATLFLTQPVCMKFWVTLAMGTRRDDPEMSARNGKSSQRIDNHVELTEGRAKTVIEHLKSVGNSRLVHFRFNRRLQALDNANVNGSAYAISLPICDYKGIDTECHGGKGSLIRSVIRFHADYYVVAKKLSQLKYQEVSQKLRFSFGFAALIVHEIAHSIEGIHFRERTYQWLDWQTSGYYKEPYWLDWHESECGRAWEQTMFGGYLQPINSKVDGSHGIGIADWPFGGTNEDPQSYRWYTVSMDYIEHMFQMSTWQRSFNLKDWRIFNIPRDGATSLYINSFTTMNPSEEERVAKEEMADLLARSKEEPASKKRVIALGKIESLRPDEGEVIEHAVTEDQEESHHVLPKRQVPNFPGTRRLSSVMCGPLPDGEPFRQILIPQTRKASIDTPKPPIDSKNIQHSAKLPTKVAVVSQSRILDGFTPGQRDFLEDQRLKDRERSIKDGKAPTVSPGLPSKRSTQTSKLIGRAKSSPKGMLARHRLRRRAQMEQKLVEEKRTKELAEQNDAERQQACSHMENSVSEMAEEKEENRQQDAIQEGDGILEIAEEEEDINQAPDQSPMLADAEIPTRDIADDDSPEMAEENEEDISQTQDQSPMLEDAETPTEDDVEAVVAPDHEPVEVVM